jgi:class 3 adenylate cyclase/tetratricopeptide (TPR) repeat protein
MPGMVRCPRCGVENPAGFSFCGGCGGRLGSVDCSSCGATVPLGQRFCGQCGTAIALEANGSAAAGSEASAHAEASAQSGVVTSSGPASERKLATILFADVVGFTGLAERSDHETVASTVAEALSRLAAIVVEHGGTVDKFLGDGMMAVFGVPVAHDDDAERAVAAALAMRDSAGELRFSIGVNTGDVMVTAMPGDDHMTVIGDAVNIAARLEKAASVGEVLVGALTAELAGKAMLFCERGTVTLHGRAEPVAVHEAVELRSTVAADTTRPPLVGRDDELAFLCARWRRCARDGRPQAVLLSGEVGSGKSRLLDELGARTDGTATVVRATYPAYGALSGARLVRDILGRLGRTGDPLVDERLESLAGAAVPALATLDADALEQEQLHAFRHLIEHHAALRPILVLIDEVQRANDRTLRFLADLIVRTDAPVLLVLAGRPEPADWLLRFPHTTRLRLEPLGPEESAELATSLVPEGRLSPAAAAVLAERGAGNPLHLRELVRLVREREGLFGAADGLELRGDLALPPSLQAVLAARLDALPPGDKATFQHLAVLGEEATLSSLAALGLYIDEADLSRLETAGLLRDREGGRVEIVDPLLRDVAYESLPREARATLHQRAGRLADRDEERARHLELAFGYRTSDSLLKQEAAEALGAAGLRLGTLHRPRDAIALVRRAVELGYRDGKALLQHAQTLVEVGRDEEAGRVLDLIESELEPADEAERVHVRGNAVARRHPEQAIALYAQAKAMWEALGDRVKAAWAVSNTAVALTLLGRLADASRTMWQALEQFTAAEDRVGVTAARQFLGLLHPEDPRIEEWMEEGLAWAREVGDPTGERYGIQSLAWHHFMRSFLGGKAEIARALEHAEALARASDEIGDQIGAAYGHAIAAILLRSVGEFDGCIAHATAARDLELEAGTGAFALRDSAVLTADLLSVADAPLPHSLFQHGDTPGLLGVGAAAIAAVLAGRLDDTRALVEPLAGGNSDATGLQTVKIGLVDAMRRLLGGEVGEAGSRLVATVSIADNARFAPAAACARALLAETMLRSGDELQARRLLRESEAGEGGIAGLFRLRVRARLAEPGALELCRAEAERLRAPGALIGM